MKANREQTGPYCPTSSTRSRDKALVMEGVSQVEAP